MQIKNDINNKKLFNQLTGDEIFLILSANSNKIQIM